MGCIAPASFTHSHRSRCSWIRTALDQVFRAFASFASDPVSTKQNALHLTPDIHTPTPARQRHSPVGAAPSTVPTSQSPCATLHGFEFRISKSRNKSKTGIGTRNWFPNGGGLPSRKRCQRHKEREIRLQILEEGIKATSELLNRERRLPGPAGGQGESASKDTGQWSTASPAPPPVARPSPAAATRRCGRCRSRRILPMQFLTIGSSPLASSPPRETGDSPRLA
jgi:hypothetical protein